MRYKIQMGINSAHTRQFDITVLKPEEDLVVDEDISNSVFVYEIICSPSYTMFSTLWKYSCTIDGFSYLKSLIQKNKAKYELDFQQRNHLMSVKMIKDLGIKTHEPKIDDVHIVFNILSGKRKLK